MIPIKTRDIGVFTVLDVKTSFASDKIRLTFLAARTHRYVLHDILSAVCWVFCETCSWALAMDHSATVGPKA
jgi:hypothetical protein